MNTDNDSIVSDGGFKTYRMELQSVSPYSQSKHHSTPYLEKEGYDAHELRTWRERQHYDHATGEVYIPPMAIKNCLAEAAKFLSIKIPGKRNNTYTKHVEAGTMVITPIPLGVHKDQVPGEEFFVPSNGVRGGGTRVLKTFPRIDSWKGTCEVVVTDQTVTKAVLYRVACEAGNLIGIGRFRPRNNGFYGRFRVVSLEEVG